MLPLPDRGQRRAEETGGTQYDRQYAPTTTSLLGLGASSSISVKTCWSRGKRRTWNLLGPSAEADEEPEPREGDLAREPVNSPPEDLQLGKEFWGYEEDEAEAPAPPKLTFMQKIIARMGGDINLALHYVGLAGLIQALVSWRTNRGLRSARRIAREMSKA